MSRSHKKNPYHNIASTRSGEMKKWKKQASQYIRNIPLDTDITNHKKYNSNWNSPSDGKTYWKPHDYKTNKEFKRLQRK